MKASAVIKRPSEVKGVVGNPLSIRASVSRVGGASVTVDPDLDPTSTNPVENKAITEAIETINGNVSSLGNAIDTLSGVVDGKYDASNPNGYISGISGNDVTTALGFTPYNATNPSGFVNATQAANAAPVQSVNSKTGAVVLDATDVGAIPDTTTFALGYDPDCSVGLAKVGDAVTGEPNYTPTGQITQTMENVSFLTGGTAKLTASFYAGTLTLGVSLTPTTTTKNVATSAPVFVGNGVHFVIKENE